MSEYKTGCPAYIEFVNKAGVLIKGVYLVVSQDRWNLELKDEEVVLMPAKKDIITYEPDLEKWPSWCGKVQAC